MSATTKPVTLRARRRRDAARNIAFLSPWLIGTGLFFLYPLVSAACFSFPHYVGFTALVWTCLDNWRYVLRDSAFFWPAMLNTIWLVIVMVTLRVIFGLSLVLLVTKVKTG